MRLLLPCFLLFCSIAVSAQEIESQDNLDKPSISKTNYLGVRFGGLASGFTHGNGQASGGMRQLGWHAGVAMDFWTKPRYNARVEMSYITKGAKETFGNDRIEIPTRNKLQYVQLSMLPVILKHDFGKVKPYIGLGGYYAQRVGIKSEWKPGGSWENDVFSATNLDRKSDFGYSIALGIYVKRRPLAELRFEGGLNAVSSTTKIKNRSIVLSLAI